MKISAESLHKAIVNLYKLLFFLTPIIFTLMTDEIFEFPKYIFLLIISAFISGLIVLKIYISKDYRIFKNPLRIPLALILGSSLLSTIFSVHFTTSVFGYYTRFTGDLVSIVLLVFLGAILFWECEQSEVQEILQSLLFGSIPVCIYAILQRLGIDKDFWVEHAWERVFSTLGQPNWLAAYLIGLVPITVIRFFKKVKQFWLDKKLLLLWQSLLWLGLLLMQISSLYFTRSSSGYAGLLFALGLLGFLIVMKKLKTRLKWLLIPLTIIILIGIYMIPPVKQTANDLFWKKETNQIRLIVWQGTLKMITKRPIIGYGIETFAYAFLPFRPEGLNQTTEWNFLFNKPHNEILEIAAESGLFGLIAYFSFMIITTYWAIKKTGKEHWLEVMSLLSAFWGVFLALCFGFQVVITQLIFFLFPMMILRLSQDNFPLIKLDLGDKIRKTGLISSEIVCGSIIFLAVTGLLANFSFVQGTISGEEEAVKLAPYENTYRRYLIYMSAQEAVKTKDPIWIAKTNDQIAILLSDNPHNYLNLQLVQKAYLEMAQIDSSFLQKSAETAQKEIDLCPSDPEGYYVLGLIKQSQDDKAAAKIAYEKALKLKPDYTDAQKALENVE